ncbi:unnamed protein product [Lactuca saligna]|uniref:Myb/SANT-like domain-containing protein n=1 Tax=Lactuca saligna TaxID=75948 RepID=A0AA36ER13_LACSI|nr:unnamed protein product [Lactuca saligna]
MRKNDIATNVLWVCSQDMQFIYILPGWEGSTADGRVLRDALLRPHGLKVPRSGVIEKIRNYHKWTIIEDAKLVEALVNMVNMGGFKADNGFKSGYLLHLENALKEKISNSDILGKPHIKSRIKTMKKDWYVVYDMVNGTNTSGFGYDSSTHSITAKPSVWNSYMQVHKKEGKWRNKIFPRYKDLCIIFCKDRAQGNNANDFPQMEEYANNEEQSEQIEDVNVLGEKLEKAGNNMNQAILGETEVQKTDSMVIPEISKMQSLSAFDRFKASRKIMCDPETVLSFWNLEGEDREDFVRFMLEE